MPALERYLQEMNEEQQQQQQQQQLGIDNITVDVHNSDDATDDDSDCRQSPLDRRHSDGQRFHHSSVFQIPEIPIDNSRRYFADLE